MYRTPGNIGVVVQEVKVESRADFEAFKRTNLNIKVVIYPELV
jgi:hypothetical protein